MTDVVRITGLTVNCVVGVFPRERNKVQPVVIDVDMYVPSERAAVSERLRDTVDYSSIASEVAFLLRACHFRLLETAAHVLAKWLLLPPVESESRAAIERVRVKLTKPGALGGLAVPSIEIERDSEWLHVGRETKPFGQVDIVHEGKDVGVYRLSLKPGGIIPLHHHRLTHETEMVLDDGLLCQHKPVSKGSAFRWPMGAAHCYENPTDHFQNILCVDSPPFQQSDEVLTDGQPFDVQPEAPWLDAGV